MIAEIGLQNFKSHQSATLELDISRLHALVGKNSAGKTSILQALYYFKRLTDESLEDIFQNENSPRFVIIVGQECMAFIDFKGSGLAPTLLFAILTINPKREAWVLNGFISETPQEAQILAEITTQLSFDPCTEAHKLRSTSKEDSDRQRNPKIILEQLIGKNQKREQQCWQNTDLIILCDRGVETSLTIYLSEIKERLSLVLLPRLKY